ncbi:hypothetical protein SmJEL517_g01093 [Synchytrium microbalum]|uniref:non-specific serine/threonine protein kinase n=1 Tax=Synchytrium microbalum TaxID=1806994 RepID=A0A507CHD2_9FUNG|nr:uncharacterized protein SmJEL517_g01093 [Synchytrium microbalum]TPX37085.1 hypothetical protein SmJEL517_g01093 [Synchytrium microbalum]
MSDKEKKQLVSEVNILRELRHPNIVRYYERFVDRENCLIYIIMEFCDGGDLASIIKRCRRENKRIPEDVIWQIFVQLLLALNECHFGGSGKSGPHPAILHRDIKPDNVLLDAHQNAKLSDFGLSRVIDCPESEFARTYVGTPFYMSPELVTETSYNMKSDIWALGCLCYELAALEPPFQAKTQAGLALKIKQGRIPPLPSQYSPDLNRCIQAMLQVNHLKRPTAADLLRVDRIKVVLRERELNQLSIELKKREDEIKKRESAIETREATLNGIEEALRRRETELEEREKAVSLQYKRILNAHFISDILARQWYAPRERTYSPNVYSSSSAMSTSPSMPTVALHTTYAALSPTNTSITRRKSMAMAGMVVSGAPSNSNVMRDITRDVGRLGLVGPSNFGGLVGHR